MIHDISAFIAIGKRVTVDFKLYGIGFVRRTIQFDSQEPNWADSIVEHIVPSVLEMLRVSSCSHAVSIADYLEEAIKSNLSTEEMVFILLDVALLISSDPTNSSKEEVCLPMVNHRSQQ